MKTNTLENIIKKLNDYWSQQGCAIHQGYDVELGAATLNPTTFLRSLGKEPYKAAYVEGCRRPSDGRYGENPNRVQHYYQYQITFKPSPLNLQELYLGCLECLGIDLSKHDIRFVQDDWENPSVGASGLGWEVWMDGMEISQFTYFQHVGSQPLSPITGELTIGLERLAMYLQNKDNIFDIYWNDELTYGDLFYHNELEASQYNFELANEAMWFRHFKDFEEEATRLLNKNLTQPAYEFVMKASHAFNILDAKGVISTTERAEYIARIRNLSRKVAKNYLDQREKADHALTKKISFVPTPIPPPPKEINLPFTNNQTGTFLLEIGSEELPAQYVERGVNSLKKQLEHLLNEHRISHGTIRTYGTARRLTIAIDDLVYGREAAFIKKRGPQVEQSFSDEGTLTKAGQGFLKGLGLNHITLDKLKAGEYKNLTIETINDKNYLILETKEESCLTAVILQQYLPRIILNIDFPKKMKWADLDIEYARPLRWLLALLDEHIIPFNVGHLTSNNISYGHRQLNNQSFTVSHPKEYCKLLETHYVQVCPEKRKQHILNSLAEIENKLNCQTVDKEIVLNQVIYMTEWPSLLTAQFNEAFLSMPAPIAISEMVEHQKYFPLQNLKDKTLINTCVLTLDTKPSEEIMKGNMRVLSARLNDGIFLFKKDGEVPLESYSEKLKNMTYMEGFGSMHDKTLRLVGHAEVLQQKFRISTQTLVNRAAKLCKCDLATEMVGEFPNLQGVIGHYYAQQQGEKEEVALALEEHWMPYGESGALPSTPTGTILSMADKLDNLLSCFTLRKEPTSSSDPHGLRRQSIAFLKMLLENHLHVSLTELLSECAYNFIPSRMPDRLSVVTSLKNYLFKRLKSVLEGYNLSYDEIDAVLSTDSDNPYSAFCKIEALKEYRAKNPEAFGRLQEVHKRAKGQLQNFEHFPFSKDFLKENAEKELTEKLEAIYPDFRKSMITHDYKTAYSIIGSLQPALNKLFEEVKILDDEETVRNNRLSLLEKVFHLFDELLDFSKLVN